MSNNIREVHKMETVRVLDRPEDFKKYGVKQEGLEAWEDGRRGNIL